MIEPNPKHDYCASFGAGILAKTIESYWHGRGARHVRAERYPLPGHDGLWGVRSNLVAGLPPKYASGGYVAPRTDLPLFGEAA